MKCNKCGHNNEPKIIYCVSCGEKIVYTKQKVKEEYQRQIMEEKIKRGIDLTQVYLIWAIIVFFILLAIRSPFTNYQKVYHFPALKVNFYQKNIPTDTLDIADINK